MLTGDLPLYTGGPGQTSGGRRRPRPRCPPAFHENKIFAALIPVLFLVLEVLILGRPLGQRGREPSRPADPVLGIIPLRT